MRARILVGVAILSWSSFQLIRVFAAEPALADNLDAIIRQWWPLAIVVLGLAGLLRLVDARQSLRGPLVLVVAGVALLLITANPFQDTWSRAGLPLALLPVGWFLVTPRAHAPASGDRANWPREVCVADSRYVVSGATGLVQATIYVAAGGLVLDLRQAVPVRRQSEPWTRSLPGHGARLELTAVLGGVDIIVPATWSVVLDQRDWAGRCRNRVPEVQEERLTGRLEIAALVILGGVEITRLSRSS
ncbi:hypothetical protein [Pseudofrankia sp. DC12]|uniref:hypothetical protein n=1 Tax=Pseudofrankia sp. DC12 TaxID=683315 RepID=UPI0018DD8D47|nr:hypothetical protein [Pseudofrankia sp. DC12]